MTRSNEERYKEALEKIWSMMGPMNSEHVASCITCEGCRFEWEETLQVVRNVLDGKDADDHWGEPVVVPELKSWSQFRRLSVVGGDDWWVNHEAPPNGIGDVCLFCNRLVDWAPRDHTMDCPVRRYLRWEDDDEV